MTIVLPRHRLVAGSLALLLPLGGAAACGVEKQRTVKAELALAQTNLGQSKVMSVTLHLADPKGSLAKAMGSGADPTPTTVTQAVLAGGITVTVDPAGAQTLAQVSRQTGSTTLTPEALTARLKKVQLALAVKDARGPVVELRLVDGVLYAHVDLAEISRLAGDSSVQDGLTQAEADPTFGPLVKDVRAGKWVRLDLAPLLRQFAALAQTVSPQLTTPRTGATLDTTRLGRDLFAAVKPYVRITDANDSSSDRVLDVRVQLRPAVKAALAVLRATKGLPGLALLQGIDAGAIDRTLSTGTVDGQLRLADGHLTQLSLDLQSARNVAARPGGPDLTGSKVIVDVDDTASPVTVPTNVSRVDLGALVDQFFGAFTGGPGEGMPSSYAG